MSSKTHLWKVGALINIPEVNFKLTGKFSAPRKGEEGPGKTYVPPLTLNMTNSGRIKARFSLPTQAEQLPESFSWANDDEVRKYKGSEYVGLIESPLNQGTCGSCWAFATTTCLSDRMAIARKSKNPLLGPSYLLSCSISGDCDRQNLMGCNGGNIEIALKNMVKPIGTVQTSCWNYDWCTNGCDPSGDGNINNSLIPNFSNSNKCLNSKDSPLLYKIAEGSVIPLGSFKDIKSSIFNKGPIPTGFFVYGDFFLGSAPASQGGDSWAATKGIYVHLDTDSQGNTPKGDHTPYNYNGGVDAMNQIAGAHAVSIVGWGIDEVPNFLKKLMPNNATIKLPYWIVRNSWGPTWNDKGYFKIAMTDSDKNINTNIKLDSAEGGVGGPIDFDPDIKTAPLGISIHQQAGGGKISTHKWLLIGLGIILLIILCLLVWLLMKKKQGFR